MDLYDKFILGLHILEAAACLTGFLVWKKIKNTYWKWFAVYLLVIILIEGAGWVLNAYDPEMKAAAKLFRYFGMPVQMLFFYWLFYKEFRESSRKKLPIIAAAIFLVAHLYDLIADHSLEKWINSFSYTVGNVLLAGLVLVFFFKYIQTERILTFRSDMMFWVCVGILVFYVGSLPYFGLYNILVKKENIHILLVYWYFQMAFNYIMYSCFTIAFLWGKPR